MKYRLIFLVTALSGHLVATAQKIVTQNPVFHTANQSMWGGGSAPGLNMNFEIFPEYKVALPFNTGSFTKLSFSGLDFGAVLDGYVGFGIGPFQFDISGFTAGSIDVDYPAAVTLDMPADNTFNPGETLVIKSAFQAAPGAQLTTHYPEAGSIGLYMDMFFDASFGVQACFIDCAPRLSIIPPPGLNINPLFDETLTFFEVSPTGVTYLCDNSLNYYPPQPFTNAIQCELSSGGPPWSITTGAFTGTLDIPHVSTTSSVVNARNLVATGSDPYVIPSVDIIDLLGYIPPIKPATGIIKGSYKVLEVPDITGEMRAITVDWALADIDLNIPIAQSQDFRFEPRIFTSLKFPDTVDYVVHSVRTGNVPGRGVSFEYEAGDSVSVRFPCNYDFMDVYATHRIVNRFSNKTFDNISLELDFAAIDFGVTIDPYVIIPEICIPIPFAGDLCIPEVGFPGASFDPPPLVDPPPLTLISQDFPPYFEDQWELGGFNIVDAPQPFRLKPRERAVNFLVQNVSCFGDSTGAIVTTVPGASAPLKYEWSFGSTDPNPVEVPAGRHYLKLTDANRCESIESVEVIQPPEIAVAFANDAILCNGGATSISAAATGGTGALSYTWNSGETTPTLTGKRAGTYSVSVTDGAGCGITDSITVTQPTPLVAKIASASDPSCAGIADGAAKLFVEGGTAPYRYVWSNGSELPDQQHLAGGTYSVAVYDANDCPVTDAVTLTTPAMLTASLTKLSDVSCFSGSDAALRVQVNGGTAPYTYRWYDSLVTLSATEPLARDLGAGTYSVEVTDSRDCQVVQKVTVTAPARPLQADIIPSPGICYDDASGALDLTVQGGSPPYRYVWSDGQSTEDRSHVPAGKYEVTVTDAHGCQYRNMALLVDPDQIRIGLSRRDVSCAEQQDGQIAISGIRGGTAPYDIRWSNGETDEKIENLRAGTYSVTVSDALGCSATESVSVRKREADCLFIPNAFSPNGDGTNDTWNIRNMGLYADAQVKVFNKWGNVVFQSHGYAHPWDGSYRGRTLEPATYYYFVDLGNGDPVYQGYVMIVR